MSSLAELKKKYKLEGARHDPNPDCKFCKGTGERRVKSTGELTFCICLFVDHDMSDLAGDLLGEFARKQLKKMKNNE